MQNLEVYLKELLYRFDRVVIPNLGEFVSYYKPAYRDKAKNVFYPPSKHLSFTTEARVFDELLVNEIAVKTSEEKSKVRSFIEAEVQAIKAKLEENGTAELEKIGTFHLSKFGKITFQIDQTENFLLDSFGLFPVYSPQISIEEKVDVIELGAYQEAEVVEEIPLSGSTALTTVHKSRNGEALPVKWHSTFKRYKIGVAAAVGLLLIPTAYHFGGSELSSNSQFSFLNPFGGLFSEAKYQPRSVERINEIAEENTESKIQINSKEEIKSSTIIAELKSKKVKPVARNIEDKKDFAKEENIFGNVPSNHRYHLINGCYKEEKNAAKWVRNLRKKGRDAYILDKHKGLYRVAMGSFESRKSAHKQYSMLKREGVKSWILKR